MKITIPETDALMGLFKVRPTAAMPRPGAHPSKAKKTAKRNLSK